MKYTVNQPMVDEFGRVSGVFAYNKPAGITSHDVVYKFRRHFGTKAVGHAGALDPFATGLIIVLVGKATKLSDSILQEDKTYIAQILLGIETNSGDPEGEVLNSLKIPIDITDQQIAEALTKFIPSYIQSVPVFSSVKVDGQKLRNLARSYKSFKVEKLDGKSFVRFLNDNNEVQKTIEIPSKEVKIYKLNINYVKDISATDLKEELLKSKSKFSNSNVEDSLFLEKYKLVEVELSVSKGTYIRQIAVDLGSELGIGGMLLNLKRVSSGEFNLNDAYSLEQD